MIASGFATAASTISPDSVVTLAIVILPIWAGSTAVRAGVAQLVEHLICNQTVGGSSPFARSRVLARSIPPQSFQTDLFPLSLSARENVCGMGWCGRSLRGCLSCAQVAERLMAADCKSAAPWSYGGSNPPLCTMDWNDGPGTWIAGTEVDIAGPAGGPLRFSGQDHRSGQGALGGVAIIGLFRAADCADRVRFAIAWQ